MVKITGFWHICMINDFMDIIIEQFVLMVKSGLYDSLDEINVVALGPIDELGKLKTLFSETPKIRIVIHNTDLGLYEFPALTLLHNYSKQNRNEYVFYIHTKGVYDTRGKHWRDYMNYFNLTKWRDCISKLKEGFDIVGVKWIKENRMHPKHFSGNFFHATTNYISALPCIDTLDKTIRHNAEFWHGMANPKWHSLSQIMIDHFNKPQFK